jgi:hypothetical protein
MEVHPARPEAGGTADGFDIDDSVEERFHGDGKSWIDIMGLKFGLHAYRREILTMDLEENDKQTVAYALVKADTFRKEGMRWKRKGDNLYTVQVLGAALVPVLIGLIGSFDNHWADIFLRVAAIMLSIAGTICKAIEDVYHYRQRGQIRIQYSDKMKDLYHYFLSLSGRYFDPAFAERNERALKTPNEYLINIPDLSMIPINILKEYMKMLELEEGSHRQRNAQAEAQIPIPNTHRGANFRKFCVQFNLLQKACRNAAFVGSGLPKARDPTKTQ